MRVHTMGKNNIYSVNSLLQWGVFLCVNILFVCKYIPRAGYNPFVSSILYGITVIGVIMLYKHLITPRLNERKACYISITILTGIVTCIALAILLIDPLTIRVDRWSATSYFLDALFQGIYPYSVHTHVCDTNYPSPFPFWHYLNIPFWLLGDVGWIQVFSLLLFIFAIWYYYRSWHIILNVLLLFCLSPAYWWEIATRSDGVSNILFMLSCIMFIQRKPIEMSHQWWLLAIIAGCIASTRLSSVIPLALYLFRPWFDVDWKRKTGFICIALAIVLFFFAPYILWDTTNWVFFERNPFITQSRQGNSWILLCMVIVAICIAYKKQTFYYYVSTTSVFMFAFMFFSQLAGLVLSEAPFSFIDDRCDISYFTLSLPFAILSLSYPKRTTP